jgi:hypothetical protein
MRKAGDLNLVARRSALSRLDPPIRAAVLLRAEAMQAELDYAGAPLLERLLIEQVVTCWLHVELAQLIYGHTILNAADHKTMHTLERRTAGAQRRYLKALEMLLKFRSKIPRLRPETLNGPLGQADEASESGANALKPPSES